MGLQRYKQKRNFGATPEPEGKVKPRKGALTFVIQKHDATRLHYDFRLEMEGVLKSWAVPKGVPTTKGERRLAMHVEDHPLDYGGFEGTIPEGNYGAGTVMVWDNGTWENLGGDPVKDLEAGKLHFALHGQKLEGEWTLVRMRARSEASGKDEWLLIKSGEDIDAISAKKDDESVLTHRTLDEIAKQRTREWKSNREDAAPKNDTFKARVAAAAKKRKPEASRAKKTRPSAQKRSRQTKAKDDEGGPASVDLTGFPAEKPSFIDPMKATLVETLPPGKWLLELKHDGYRALAVKDGDTVKLYSRNHREITHEFPSVAEAMRRLPAQRAVLDGEVVALNEQGHGSFQLLQNREHIRGENRIIFYVFDILNLEARNVRDLPLTSRRGLLKPLVDAGGGPMRFSVELPGAPQVVLDEVKRLSLEGIIAKRPESKYEAGRRSSSWLKLKCVSEQEFVIGGYTPPKGSRDFFGALLVGYYENGKLVFASKVGSGYSQKRLRELHRTFEPLRIPKCPFVNLPTKRTGKFGQGVTASEMKQCVWIEPRLVAQVRFTEWTGDGGLRHPVFLGMRQDKRASEVTKEAPND
jgi:bifunctional non-homologous end joining protein LigD